jgi:hypothetical protein
MWRCWLVAATALVVWRAGCVQGQRKSFLDGATLRHRTALAKVGTISKVRWIDSNTDQPSKLLLPNYLVDGDVFWMERDDFDTNLTLDAIADGGPVGSVRFQLFSQINRRENFAPWAMCGNRVSDFFACSPRIITPDNGNLIVTPYSEQYGLGMAGESFNAYIVIYTAQDCDLFFRGINADTDQVKDRIEGSNYVVNVTSTPVHQLSA